MAGVVVLYGPRGTGKTTATLRLASLLAAHGRRVGGFFQRLTVDDLERRSYELVRLADPTHAVALARPKGGSDASAPSSVHTVN